MHIIQGVKKQNWPFCLCLGLLVLWSPVSGDGSSGIPAKEERESLGEKMGWGPLSHSSSAGSLLGTQIQSVAPGSLSICSSPFFPTPQASLPFLPLFPPFFPLSFSPPYLTGKEFNFPFLFNITLSYLSYLESSKSMTMQVPDWAGLGLGDTFQGQVRFRKVKGLGGSSSKTDSKLLTSDCVPGAIPLSSHWCHNSCWNLRDRWQWKKQNKTKHCSGCRLCLPVYFPVWCPWANI